jgi:cytochrome c-type biogenesis protein CcmH/NrfG
MRAINFKMIISIGLLLIVSFYGAVMTPPLHSAATPTAMSSEERAALLRDWTKQISLWKAQSVTASSAVSSNVLGASVAKLPETGRAVKPSESVFLDMFEALLVTLTVIAIVSVIKVKPWQPRRAPTRL